MYGNAGVDFLKVTLFELQYKAECKPITYQNKIGTPFEKRELFYIPFFENIFGDNIFSTKSVIRLIFSVIM